jgi:hypothetical protein
MMELRRPKLDLVVEFTFDEFGNWMHMHHIGMIEKIGMIDCSTSCIPMNPGQVLRKVMHAPLVNQKLYRLIVGSFLFATNS